MDGVQLNHVNTPSAAGYQAGGVDHNGQYNGHHNIYFIWDQLKQHDRFTEHFRHIRALVFATDALFRFFASLRNDPNAGDFLEDLHLSAIHHIPPADIFELIVSLRMHPDWLSVRDVIFNQIDRNKHRSTATTSTRNSAASNRSIGHLSSASARSYSTTATSYSHIQSVAEASDDDECQHHPSRSDTVRGPTAVTASGKPSQKAPDHQRFTCPYKKCRKVRGWKRIGDWDRHHQLCHRNAPELNPFEYLQPDLPISAQTPVKTESVESLAGLPLDSPSSTYVEVNAFDDFPATGPEYHLPMHQLSNANPPMMPHQNYYRNTGVQQMPDNTGFQQMQDPPSWFQHEDDMDEK